jgi:hypothetical protein
MTRAISKHSADYGDDRAVGRHPCDVGAAEAPTTLSSSAPAEKGAVELLETVLACEDLG